MKVYILRHGTTNWNEQGRTQGRRQNRLSKAGVKLAEATAEKLKNTKIDVIYASPLMRTMQTANIINKYHGLKINKCELITEVDQGVYSGRLYKTLTEEEKRLKKERHPSTGMEQMEDAYARVKKFVETVLKTETHENILVVSHNNICSDLSLVLTDTKPNFDDYAQMNSFANAEVKEFDFKA